MEVMSGLFVRLDATDGGPIELLPCRSEARTFEDDNSAIDMNHFPSGVTIKPGTLFSIIIEIDPRKFRIYTAEGLKFTLAIGHTHQQSGALVDVQAQFLPLRDELRSQERITKHISNMMHYGGSDPTEHPLRIPGYEPIPDTDLNDKLMSTYNASKGHITLFVTRGTLKHDTDHERTAYATDPQGACSNDAHRTMGPIRYEWFGAINSNNGITTVIDFPNIESDMFEAIKISQPRVVSPSTSDFQSEPRASLPSYLAVGRKAASRQTSHRRYGYSDSEDVLDEDENVSEDKDETDEDIVPDSEGSEGSEGSEDEEYEENGHIRASSEYSDLSRDASEAASSEVSRSARSKLSRKRKRRATPDIGRPERTGSLPNGPVGGQETLSPPPRYTLNPEPNSPEHELLPPIQRSSTDFARRVEAEPIATTPSRPVIPPILPAANPAVQQSATQPSPAETRSLTPPSEMGVAATSLRTERQRLQKSQRLQLLEAQLKAAEARSESKIQKAKVEAAQSEDEVTKAESRVALLELKMELDE